MGRDVVEQLADETLVALRVAGGDWPRSLLSEAQIPDGWIGLVATPDGRRRLAPSGESPRCDRADKLLLVRDRSIEVPLETSDCVASGGNVVNARCQLLLRWRADENDLAALGRRLLQKETLTVERLAEHFADEGGTAALETFVRERTAAELVRGDLRDALLAVLRPAMKRFTFECGGMIERIAQLEFASDTFARKQALERDTARRVEQIESRKMVEQAALSATSARLDDLKGVLDKLKAAATDENSRWQDLLPALSPAERGRLLENLWRITPNRRSAAAIVAIAGSECLWLDPADPEKVATRISLAEDLGGLRSVAFDASRNQLLIGAATGVWTLDAGTGEVAGKFEVPDIEPPRTAFNEAIVVADRLYATHSKLGCWCWPLDSPGDPAAVFEPEGGAPKTVRAVTAADDGRVFFAGGSKVWFYDPQTDEAVEFATIGDSVHALAIIDNMLFVGSGDGKLLRGSLESPGRWTTLHRTRDAIESIIARRWNDLVELVIPAGDEGVVGVYGDENVVVKLIETPVAIRRAWACDDAVVGLSDRRDRLLVMNANLPERTARDVPVGRMIGHSVQDACIVTLARALGA